MVGPSTYRAVGRHLFNREARVEREEQCVGLFVWRHLDPELDVEHDLMARVDPHRAADCLQIGARVIAVRFVGCEPAATAAEVVDGLTGHRANHEPGNDDQPAAQRDLSGPRSPVRARMPRRSQGDARAGDNPQGGPL